MAKKLTREQVLERDKYALRVRRTTTQHKYNFNALALAKKGKLTGAQKTSITRQYKNLRGARRGLRKQRLVFVPVKSDYRRRRAMETGTVVERTNRGVFVSVNQGQIERGGLGKLRVSVGIGGGVSISYGETRVETVAINRLKFARNPAKLIQREFEKRRARAVSVVINGYEARGASSAGIVNSQAWMQYTNDLLDRIERDMMEADKRRTDSTVKQAISRDIVAFRFYYGKGVTTTSLKQYLKTHAPEDGEDFSDLSDDE